MQRKLKFRAWKKYDEDEREEHSGKAGEMIPADELAFEEYEPLVDQLNGDDTMELMQYTGMTDVKGTEIYEGDIVKTDGEVINVVEWDDTQLEWTLDYAHKYRRSLWLFYDIRGRADNDIKVVGNIYENPELVRMNDQTAVTLIPI